MQRLVDAGAIYVGKTNLDQFATGLNGTRTPYGLPRSVFGDNLISGGSSSGSALAVAGGEVPFAVATDTAGSGRVPPALNGIVGFKPSRGLISTVGLVPACRSLDCISLMARTVPDVGRVLDVVAATDERDPYSRSRIREFPEPTALRIDLPDIGELEFFGDKSMRDAHLAARSRIGRQFNQVVTVPFGPFLAAGELLYQGRGSPNGSPSSATSRPSTRIRCCRSSGRSWPAARRTRRSTCSPRSIGWETCRPRSAGCGGTWTSWCCPPSARPSPLIRWLADPIATNTMLGHYTHFGNLLDLCGAVVPAGLTLDDRPAALMVLGPALSDDRVLAVAAALSGQSTPAPTATVPAGAVTLVVVGHHLSGQPRSRDLIEHGGRVLAGTTTAARYRLLRTGDDTPVPVLVTGAGRRRGSDRSGDVAAAGRCPSRHPRPVSPSVCLGRVELADGSTEIGFVADTSALDDEDLSTSPPSAAGGPTWPNAEPAARIRPVTPTTPHPWECTVPDTVTAARPAPFSFDVATTALVVIDMQRDFLLPGDSARRSAMTSRCRRWCRR